MFSHVPTSPSLSHAPTTCSAGAGAPADPSDGAPPALDGAPPALDGAPPALDGAPPALDGAPPALEAPLALEAPAIRPPSARLLPQAVNTKTKTNTVPSPMPLSLICRILP